jgi:archaellum component FlaC
MKKQNQETNTHELVIASLLNTIKELKTELENLHPDYASVKNHNSEECSCCQVIFSAKTMLTIHKAN